MSTLTHYSASTGVTSPGNKARKRNKRHPHWRGKKIKTYLSEEDMICILKKNSKEFRKKKKLSDLVNKFRNTSEYKINTPKKKKKNYRILI